MPIVLSHASALARIAVLGLAGVAIVPAPASPATPTTVAVSGALRQDVHDGRLQDAWNPGAALEADVSWRRHRNVLRLGAETAHHASRTPGAPDFRSVLAYVGWERERGLLPAVNVFGGLRTGLFLMLFEDDAEPTVDPTESELAFAAVAGVRRRARGWSAGLAAQVRVITTDPRITQVFVGVEVGRTVATLR